MSKPLALSLGDPAGIGPELICAAWLKRQECDLTPFVVAGGADVLEQAAAHLSMPCPIVRVGNAADALTVFGSGIPVTGAMDAAYRPGQPNKAGAQLAWDSLCRALELATGGTVSALVTAPVSKAAIAQIDPGFIGQTELCADSCHVAREDAVMLLAGPSLRTVPLTVHCALSQVPGMITHELILRRCRVIHRAMQRDFAMAAPRLAIAGLNPHAGEDGRMGREEIEIIAPAIAQLQAEGIAATGPHPADTLFAPHARGTYDVAVAMYHDQALAPLKALDFDQGVNMTLGLPIIRTSPDHGTAFDIAGQGIARPDSLLAAIRMAGQAARQRAASA